MSDSLQDQLRALGLAKKQPRKNKVAGNGHGPRQKKQRPPLRDEKPGEMSLERAYALKRREEQKQADKARRKKQAEDRQRRVLNSKIREIVKAGRLNRDDAEVARNFLFRGRIRKVNVTPDQLKQLNSGGLGIVYLSGGYHLLEPSQVDKVRGLSPEHVVDLDTNDSDEDEDFPVPDDLTW